jgi:hypothetical protein
MMTSLIFATTRVKCTTYSCAYKINLTLNIVSCDLPDKVFYQVKLTEEKVKAQVGKSQDDIMKRLLETKQQL